MFFVLLTGAKTCPFTLSVANRCVDAKRMEIVNMNVIIILHFLIQCRKITLAVYHHN